MPFIAKEAVKHDFTVNRVAVTVSMHLNSKEHAGMKRGEPKEPPTKIARIIHQLSVGLNIKLIEIHIVLGNQVIFIGSD